MSEPAADGSAPPIEVSGPPSSDGAAPPAIGSNLPAGLRGGLVASLLYAADGIQRTLVTQRNMRVHWVSGLAVMLVGMALPLDIASRASVICCVIMVLAMEVLNSALEAFVDLHVRTFERHAMIAKDAAAAAVLIFAVGAVVIFSDILFHRWWMVTSSLDAVRRTIVFGTPLLASVIGILMLRRSVPLILALTATALGLLTWLAFHSRDEVFSLGALTFVCGASIARLREPKLIG
jgi:diacylglycerol kinase (ATP)